MVVYKDLHLVPAAIVCVSHLPCSLLNASATFDATPANPIESGGVCHAIDHAAIHNDMDAFDVSTNLAQLVDQPVNGYPVSPVPRICGEELWDAKEGLSMCGNVEPHCRRPLALARDLCRHLRWPYARFPNPSTRYAEGV